MKKILIAYDSKTGRTEKMAEYIAEGVRSDGNEATVKKISDIPDEKGLAGYDAYIFGCPTYFKDITEDMKKFLFNAKEAGLKGKVGGAFGSYTHLGNAPRIIHDTMAYVYEMIMADMGELNVKEQMVDSGKGKEPCLEFGKSFSRRIE